MADSQPTPDPTVTDFGSTLMDDPATQAPAAEPVTEPAPSVQPEPEPQQTAPEPAPEPEPAAPAPEPQAVPEPAAEPVASAPASDPVAEPAPIPVQQQEPVSQPTPQPAADPLTSDAQVVEIDPAALERITTVLIQTGASRSGAQKMLSRMNEEEKALLAESITEHEGVLRITNSAKYFTAFDSFHDRLYKASLEPVPTSAPEPSEA